MSTVGGQGQPGICQQNQYKAISHGAVSAYPSEEHERSKPDYRRARPSNEFWCGHHNECGRVCFHCLGSGAEVVHIVAKSWREQESEVNPSRLTLAEQTH